MSLSWLILGFTHAQGMMAKQQPQGITVLIVSEHDLETRRLEYYLQNIPVKWHYDFAQNGTGNGTVPQGSVTMKVLAQDARLATINEKNNDVRTEREQAVTTDGSDLTIESESFNYAVQRQPTHEQLDDYVVYTSN